MSADDNSLLAADTMTATRRIPAPPDTVFAVLADPTVQSEIHGADRVDEAVDAGRTGTAFSGSLLRLAVSGHRIR